MAGLQGSEEAGGIPQSSEPVGDDGWTARRRRSVSSVGRALRRWGCAFSDAAVIKSTGAEPAPEDAAADAVLRSALGRALVVLLGCRRILIWGSRWAVVAVDERVALSLSWPKRGTARKGNEVRK